VGALEKKELRQKGSMRRKVHIPRERGAGQGQKNYGKGGKECVNSDQGSAMAGEEGKKSK